MVCQSCDVFKYIIIRNDKNLPYKINYKGTALLPPTQVCLVYFFYLNMLSTDSIFQWLLAFNVIYTKKNIGSGSLCKSVFLKLFKFINNCLTEKFQVNNKY